VSLPLLEQLRSTPTVTAMMEAVEKAVALT